jgi:hypothetical protein
VSFAEQQGHVTSIGGANFFAMRVFYAKTTAMARCGADGRWHAG